MHDFKKLFIKNFGLSNFFPRLEICALFFFRMKKYIAVSCLTEVKLHYLEYERWNCVMKKKTKQNTNETKDQKTQNFEQMLPLIQEVGSTL